MAIEKIIVLEDDAIVRRNLEQQLRNRRYDVAAVETIAEAQEYLNRDNFDLIFLDVRLPDGDGTDLLKAIQLRPQKPLAVVMSGFGTVESAVDCMKNGAFDYLIKPFSAEQLGVTLKKAEEFTQLVRVNRFLTQDNEDTGCELLGQSPAMENLRQLIRKVAHTQATVLIQGESGTGKELVARALYRDSTRASAPFIKVNCAAIPENLIESEFFGHERGAFTGAMNKREGRFELAHGGTILLDEISEISPSVQAKLLRVLQERELERVGGNRTIKVDVRVIATTNRRLDESVEKKEFRQDLFFRLNVVPIHVPPLRERLEDVPFLAQEFMRRFSRKHGAQVHGLSPEAVAGAQGASLARQRPRIAERHRTRRHFVRRLRAIGTGTSRPRRACRDSASESQSAVPSQQFIVTNPQPTTPTVDSGLATGNGNGFLTHGGAGKAAYSGRVEPLQGQPHPRRENAGNQHPHPPQQIARI